MSKKTLSLIIILLILTIILVIVALSTKNPVTTPGDLKTTPTTSMTKPSPTAVPAHTLLSLSPNPVTPLAAGTSSATTVSVEIDTGIDTVRGVQLEIAYDPALLTGMSIKPGTFFTDATALPIGGVNSKIGRITYAITSSSIKASRSGKGTIATLSFYPARNTGVISTPITILEKSLVTAVGMGTQSVLKQVMGTTVMLTNTKTISPLSPTTTP
jgi:hypothetical protein